LAWEVISLSATPLLLLTATSLPTKPAHGANDAVAFVCNLDALNSGPVAKLTLQGGYCFPRPCRACSRTSSSLSLSAGTPRIVRWDPRSTCACPAPNRSGSTLRTESWEAKRTPVPITHLSQLICTTTGSWPSRLSRQPSSAVESTSCYFETLMSFPQL